MTDEELIKTFGWKDVCSKPGCYSPWKHTHKLDQANFPKKFCCDNVMTVDAQCYQAFGIRILLNCYQCQTCGSADQVNIQLDPVNCAPTSG